MTCDVHLYTSIPLQNVFYSLCPNQKAYKPPCVSRPIIDLKCKSHKSSRPLWNAAPSTHSQTPFNCIKTAQFQINIPKHAASRPGLRLEAQHVRDELQRVTVPQSM